MRTDRIESSRLRFGVFEVDLGAGELRKQGVKIRLQDQPFQVLAVLLDGPGRVVTREELQKRLWSADTFVDFDRGLNKAMNRLREALEDAADSPRFIETIPKRGYRFIAPVEQRFGSIAVLPLENLSGDPSRDYWADGITDELITLLAKVSGLRIISRASVMRFKNNRLPVDAIARLLGVDALLEGSVVVANGKIRIRVQLVDAISDRHLWTESYDRALNDIVILQQEIARAITQQIVMRLTGGQEAQVPQQMDVNPDAYEAYLKGRFFWNKRTAADLQKSIDYFEQAIGLEPQYAAAYAGLADAYTTLGILGFRPPGDTYPEARQAAEHALRLDETLAEAHCSLAVVLHALDWAFEDAAREFTRALVLNANLSIARLWYGAVLWVLGRSEEAIAEARRARDLDPLSPFANAFTGLTYMFARRHDEAVDASRRALELDPHSPFVRYILARSLDAQGDLRQALTESEAAAVLSRNSPPFSAQVAYAHARLGDVRQALEWRERLKAFAPATYVSPYHFAVIDTGLGDHDSAFAWLDRASEERTTRLTTELQADPVFDDLRSDPRFDALRRRIGLPM